MIKNERQYRITKAQADRFSQTLDSLGQRSGETEGAKLRYLPDDVTLWGDPLDQEPETMPPFSLPRCRSSIHSLSYVAYIQLPPFRLAAANEDVPTVNETLGQGIPGLRRAWRHICDDIDYVPVFELAANILDVLEDGPHEIQTPVIAPLVKAMEDTRRLEGHDLSGRLFHTLLTDAKFTGAYYTSVPAATLLARLVFHDWPPHIDWSDHEFPASLNVADLACGTGTLLMAVATEVERRHTAAGGGNAAELHKAMVEQALHGYDVQLSAIHFAATSLAMLNPDIQFDRMNLYVMPLGAEGSNISLGSLDFLGAGEAAVQFALSVKDMGVATRDAERVSGGGSRGAEEGVTATLPELDLAIMNPPFTRSVGGNLLFGSLPATERRKLQNELSRRLKQRQASATAGLGAAFVAAAAARRGTLGAGAARHRVHRTILGTNSLSNRAQLCP